MLTPETYFSVESDREYISSHQVGNFIECPAKEVARLNGEYTAPDKRCFLIGHYVDAALTTPDLFQNFCDDKKSEIFKKNGDPYADILTCIQMVDSAKQDAYFMSKLVGVPQLILEGTIDGVPIKGIPDIVNAKRKRFVDLKTSKDFETTYDKDVGKRVPWYETFNYWRQLSFYQHLIRDNYGELFLPVIAGVSKQSPPARQVISFQNQERLDWELSEIRELIPLILDWKSGKEKAPMCKLNSCDWCREKQPTKAQVAESKYHV